MDKFESDMVEDQADVKRKNDNAVIHHIQEKEAQNQEDFIDAVESDDIGDSFSNEYWTDVETREEEMESPEEHSIYDSSKSEHIPSSLQCYLTKMGRIPLLSAEEEQILAKKVAEGDEEARTKMISANLRLVVSIARKYIHLGIPYLDLIQNGNVGLVHAVDMFDSTKGVHFSSYAIWWIRVEITKAISDQVHMIHIPVKVVIQAVKINRERKKLTQELDREPTYTEISQRMGIPEKKIFAIDELYAGCLSFEAPIYESEDLLFGDSIADGKQIAPDRYVNQQVLREELWKILQEIPKKERQVLILHYGLQGGRKYTLAEIGTKFGVTKERARQIEVLAIQEFKQAEHWKHLEGFQK